MLLTITRVGNVTNYDKLTLEVWTDGSIKPDEAVDMASTILIDYLKLFQTSDGKGSVITVAGGSEPEAPEPSKQEGQKHNVYRRFGFVRPQQ